MSEIIQFQAQVCKVQTMVDGGIRVTFDMPSDALEAMAKLAACSAVNAWLDISCVTGQTESNDASEKAATDGGAPMGRRRLAKRRD